MKKKILKNGTEKYYVVEFSDDARAEYNEYHRKYRAAHKEKNREYMRAYMRRYRELKKQRKELDNIVSD